MAWTLFVWVGRLRNLWQEPGPLSEVSTWSLVGSLVFTVAALSVASLWVATRFFSFGAPGLRVVVFGLAAFTTVIWLIRAVDIALGDHSVPFIVVHVVLAVVSIGLAVFASRSLLQPRTVIASKESGEPGRASVG